MRWFLAALLALLAGHENEMDPPAITRIIAMRIVACILLLSGLASAAHAQTATPVTPGYLSTTGCPPSGTPCFLPYSTLNPLPVSSAGGGGGGTSSNFGAAFPAAGTAIGAKNGATARSSSQA
jgi:hypothetical protein